MTFAQGATALYRLAGQMERAGPRAEVLMATEMIASLTRIRDKAKRVVPVRTGFLRSTIGKEVNAALYSTGGGIMRGYVSATAPYAADVEFDTHEDDGTLRRKGHPYLIPAFDQELPHYLMAVGRIPHKIL